MGNGGMTWLRSSGSGGRRRPLFCQRPMAMSQRLPEADAMVGDPDGGHLGCGRRVRGTSSTPCRPGSSAWPPGAMPSTRSSPLRSWPSSSSPTTPGVAGYGHLSSVPGRDGGLPVGRPRSARPRLATRRHVRGDRPPSPTRYDWPSVAVTPTTVGGPAPRFSARSPACAAHQPWPPAAGPVARPAIALAELGSRSPGSSSSLIASPFTTRSPRGRRWRPILLADGRIPRARTADGAGGRARPDGLAATLRQIAADGPAASTRRAGGADRGRLAADGGIMTAEDLAGTRRVFAEPPGRYRDLELRHAPTTGRLRGAQHPRPFPSAGRARQPGQLHLLAEAMGHAFADGPPTPATPTTPTSPSPASPVAASRRSARPPSRSTALAPGRSRPPTVALDRRGRPSPPPSAGGAQARPRSSPPTPTATWSR